MKRLICWIVGHRWFAGTVFPPDGWTATVHCTRCGRVKP